MSLPTQPKRDIRTGSSYLLVDFGTTSTKSALVDLDSGLFSHLLRHPSIPPQPALSGRCEISLEAIALGFEQICTSYLELTERDAFAGIEEYKRLLLEHEVEQVARHLTSQLLVYATGAEIEFADRDEVERIVTELSDSGYPVRTMIHQVVQSGLFRNR